MLTRISGSSVASSEGWKLEKCGRYGAWFVRYCEGDARSFDVELEVVPDHVLLSPSHWRWNHGEEIAKPDRANIIARIKAGIEYFGDTANTTTLEESAGLSSLQQEKGCHRDS